MSSEAALRVTIPGSADCHCARSVLGPHEDWPFHTPTGCATTREKLERAQQTYAQMEAADGV